MHRGQLVAAARSAGSKSRFANINDLARSADHACQGLIDVSGVGLLPDFRSNSAFFRPSSSLHCRTASTMDLQSASNALPDMYLSAPSSTVWMERQTIPKPHSKSSTVTAGHLGSRDMARIVASLLVWSPARFSRAVRRQEPPEVPNL